jgi:hypothetical protein
VQQSNWAVSVSLNGETLVTIANDYVSGKPEFTDAEEQVIRDAARHLEAFIGSDADSSEEPG